MNKLVFNAALLYTTDRRRFNSKFAHNRIVGALLDEIFLESESRPDLAERIAIAALGHIPSATKKGYDGETRDGRMIEAKVRNFASINGRWPESQTSNSVNDVSWAIIERYQEDNPLFIFPYFYNGHLASIFSVDFEVIEPNYVACMNSTKPGRKSFKLPAAAWLEYSRVEFVNKNPSVIGLLPKCMREYIDLGRDCKSFAKNLYQAKNYGLGSVVESMVLDYWPGIK